MTLLLRPQVAQHRGSQRQVVVAGVECARLSVQEPACTGQERAARGLEAGAQRGRSARQETSRMAGPILSLGSGKPDERPGGMPYHQPAGSSAFAASLPGDGQHPREPALRPTHPDPPRYPLAERQDDSALDGVGVHPDREVFQQDHGPSRSLGPGSNPQFLCDRRPSLSSTRGTSSWAANGSHSMTTKPAHLLDQYFYPFMSLLIAFGSGGWGCRGSSSPRRR